MFPTHVQRELRNREYAAWQAAGIAPPGLRPDEGKVIAQIELFGTTVDIPKYSVMPPLFGYHGDLQQAELYAGESLRLIHDIKPAAEVVRALVTETYDVLGALRD